MTLNRRDFLKWGLVSGTMCAMHSR
ncbi:twin-arginine translocation signal domain-containing protein [Moorena sp. SIO4G3]